jgi:hypothetical protein
MKLSGPYLRKACLIFELTYHVRWVPCQHCMVRPQVADGGNALQVWGTADKGWSSSLGVGRGANNSKPEKISLLRNITRSLGHGRIP